MKLRIVLRNFEQCHEIMNSVMKLLAVL